MVCGRGHQSGGLTVNTPEYSRYATTGIGLSTDTIREWTMPKKSNPQSKIEVKSRSENSGSRDCFGEKESFDISTLRLRLVSSLAKNLSYSRQRAKE